MSFKSKLYFSLAANVLTVGVIAAGYFLITQSANEVTLESALTQRAEADIDPLVLTF
mgnify:CR=1 FL=1